MRMIDADKLVDMLYDNEFAVLCPLDEVSGVVDACPTVDAVPVVHGRWSDAGFGELPKHAPYGWACSVCGGISFNNEYIYCPNCGAKMDGERKDGGDG